MANETTDNGKVTDGTTGNTVTDGTTGDKAADGTTGAFPAETDGGTVSAEPAGSGEEDEDERTSSTAVRQLSVVAVVLGMVAIVLCFMPHVSLMVALGVAITATVIGLVNCLSSTVLHDPRTRVVAAAGTLAGAVAVLITLLL